MILYHGSNVAVTTPQILEKGFIKILVTDFTV